MQHPTRSMPLLENNPSLSPPSVPVELVRRRASQRAALHCTSLMPCLAVRRPGTASLVHNRRGPYSRPYTTLNSTCRVYLAYRCCSGFTALVPPPLHKNSPPQTIYFVGVLRGVCVQRVTVHSTDRHPSPPGARQNDAQPSGTPALWHPSGSGAFPQNGTGATVGKGSIPGEQARGGGHLHV